MYIYKIVIKNFRNLKDFDWKPNEHINILFGPNGCGKTNVAEALSFLFSTNRYKTTFEKTDFYLGTTSNKIIIQAWLADIEAYPGDMSLKIQHINKDDEPVTDDCEEETRQVLILQLESTTDAQMEWSFVVSTGAVLCSPKERAQANYNYVDTNRNPVKEVGLNEKSVLFQLAKDQIKAEIDSISQEIVAFANQKLGSSQVLEEYLKTLAALGKIDTIGKYSILLKNPEATWNSSGYELGTQAGAAMLSFSKQSSGIQNLFLLLLMKKKLDGAGIVFIEELEQSLEPKNQRYIADEYRKMSVGQLFITSHSPEIISHFNYDNIYVVLPNGARQLFDDSMLNFKKEVTRTNKKEFISSLMANSILLIEGEAEFGAFPVYSFAHGLSMSYLDVEIIRVGGKGNLLLYANAYKKLGKNVFVLIDNDSDVSHTLNELQKIVNGVIISNNDYEDMIAPYISKHANELSALIEFQRIKNKLLSILEKSEEKCKSHEKAVKNAYPGHESEAKGFTCYEDLAKFQIRFCYALHDSFASTYYSAAIAEIIVEKDGVPDFFIDILDCMQGKTDKLELQAGMDNVWKIQRR